MIISKITKLVVGAAAAACILAAMPQVGAAIESADIPDAGKTLDDLHRTKLAPPVNKAVNVKIEEVYHPPLKAEGNTKIFVRAYKISGQQVFADNQLLALLKGSTGQEMTMSELEAQAQKITNYFRQKGYIVAKAYLPVQKVEEGVIEIAVIVGSYDKIILENKTKTLAAVLQRELGSVKSGAYIEKTALERAVWLLGDLAGADAKVTLSPGSKVGTSHLTVTLEPRTDKQGSISIDNYGNRYTGSFQKGVSYSIDNPLRQGDALSLQLLTTGGNLTGGGAFYEIPLVKQGHKFGISYTRVSYELGKEFASLHANGTADVLKLSWDYAIMRSQLHNLYGHVSLEDGKLEDHAGENGSIAKTTKAAVFSLTGDSQDKHGSTSYALSYKSGKLCIGSEAARVSDMATAKTDGAYGKWNLSMLRQQYLDKRLYLLLSFNGQLANKNLDSSEKMSLGGANGVRAYPHGEATGDEGYLATAEFRWLLPLKTKQTLQLAAFVDNGCVSINKDSWSDEDKHRTLSGTGLGLIWGKANDSLIRVNYAWKLGSEPAKSAEDKAGRVWLQGIKYF
jgi:hemolysin activation/secretion protein